MTPNNLDTLSDAELNERFAVEVAGGRIHDRRDSESVLVEINGEIDWLPHFSTDANAVLPWLENKYWESWPDGDGSRCVEVTGHLGFAPTFARAACIALIRAKRYTSGTT